MRASVLLIVALVVAVAAAGNAEMTTEKEFVNSIGMRFVRIEPGTFQMGQSGLLPFEILPSTVGRGERMDTLRTRRSRPCQDLDLPMLNSFGSTKTLAITGEDRAGRQIKEYQWHSVLTFNRDSWFRGQVNQNNIFRPISDPHSTRLY